MTYDYGMKDENPVDKVYFYDKSKPDIPKRIPKDQVNFLSSQELKKRQSNSRPAHVLLINNQYSIMRLSSEKYRLI